MDKLSLSQEKVLGLQTDTLVLAGAGAGKTATLLQALAKDLQTVPPEKIAVCTFTRSAADSLRARLEETLFAKGIDLNIDPIWIGTIDAIAARVIRTQSLRSGRDPGIGAAADYEIQEMAEEALDFCTTNREPLDAWIHPRELLLILQSIEGLPWIPEPADPSKEEVLVLLRDLQEKASSSKQKESIQNDIDSILGGKIPGGGVWNIRKESLRELRDRAAEARDVYAQALLDQKTYPLRQTLLDLWSEWKENFEKICESRGKFPFSKILEIARSRNEGPFLQKIYLDEAQDTTREQYAFLRGLLQGPLVSVGDPNQSIYGFRGADVDNFLRETSNQPEIRLEENYRSAPEILEVVEDICRPLLGSRLLRMRSGGRAALEKGEVCSYYVEDERDALVQILESELRRFRPEDISVLFRSNDDLESFYKRARAAGLPVVALRSGGLLLQEECRDLLALAKLLVHEDDQESLLRVLSSPFGGKTVDDLLLLSGDLALADFDLQEYRLLLQVTPLSEVLQKVIRDRHFDAALFLLDPGGARWSNVEQFLAVLRSAEKEGWGMEYDLLLRDFEARIREERIQTKVQGSVIFQTVHSAKGEEYELVVLPRMGRQEPRTSRRKFFIDSEGQLGIALPGGQRDSVAAREEVRAVRNLQEEEKRLLYVALTRAQKRLVMIGRKPLRGFVKELPEVENLPSVKTRSPSKPSAQADPPQNQDLGGLPPARPESLSWSSLESWSRCSLRRQLEGEWGLRGEESEGGQGQRQRGIRVHDALAGKSVELRPEEKELVRRAQAEWQRGTNPRAEVPFMLPLGDWAVRGRIDLLLDAGQEHLVLDWKTGGEDFDYSLQRKIYALAVPGSVRSETVYLLSGNRQEDFWSEKDKKSLREEVLREIEEIMSRSPEPAATSPKPFCAECPGLRVLCPVATALRAEDPPKPLDESSAKESEKEAG